MDHVKYYIYLKNLPLIGKSIYDSLVSKIYFVYEVTSVFIEAIEEV